MPLKKQTGNMYSFVTHTWNPIKGKCSHDCVYCYMKHFPLGELRLDEKELRTKLGSGNFIFIGSSTDMFAEDVPQEWLDRVFDICREYPNNRYLIQSKNPDRMCFPGNNVIFGTTIETNRPYQISKAPSVEERAEWIGKYSRIEINTMVTIEPILDFDLEPLIALVRECQPVWVNIGADSKGHGLPEPSGEKVKLLAHELEKFTHVKRKANLARLYQEERC